jgi:hypothetical protein
MTFNDKSQFFNQRYLSPAIYHQLMLFQDMYTSNGFIIDQTFRRTKTKIIDESDEASKNDLSSCFSEHDISLSSIHPLILSVIVAVCNGIDTEICK